MTTEADTSPALEAIVLAAGAELSGDDGARRLLARLGSDFAPIEWPSGNVVFDVDTISDLKPLL